MEESNNKRPLNTEGEDRATEEQRQKKTLKLDITPTAKRKMKEPLVIGCRVRSSVYDKAAGTVGPFVRIKETGDLCFITARNIFGPPPVFLDNKVIGTKVVHIMGVGNCKETVCGTVIATELTEELDVVLVKISDECKPTTGRFKTPTDEQLRKAGFGIFDVPSYNNDSMQQDARDLIQTELHNYRVIKIGSCTGLTLGKLKPTSTRNTDDYIIEKRKIGMLEVLQYREHFCVIGEGGKFAEDRDVGSAVYLVDKHNQLHCIGMIVRLLHGDTCRDEGNVLVTPIQNILQGLGEKLGKNEKLELATFENEGYEFESPFDMERFHKALEEGYEKDRQIRINIVGFFNEGKTTLTRRLLGESADQVQSTDLIEVHVRRCKLKEDGVWETCEKDEAVVDCVTRFTDVLKETPEYRSPNHFPTDKTRMAKFGKDVENIPDTTNDVLKNKATTEKLTTQILH